MKTRAVKAFRRYLSATTKEISQEDWRRVLRAAIEDAVSGDSKDKASARALLFKVVFPVGVTELVDLQTNEMKLEQAQLLVEALQHARDLKLREAADVEYEFAGDRGCLTGRGGSSPDEGEVGAYEQDEFPPDAAEVP